MNNGFLSFTEIALTKSELKTLNGIDKEQMVLAKSVPEKDAFRLERLDFISRKRFDCPEKGHQDFYQMNNLGHNYLLYIQSVKRRDLFENTRYVITTIIAVIALIVSILK